MNRNLLISCISGSAQRTIECKEDIECALGLSNHLRPSLTHHSHARTYRWNNCIGGVTAAAISILEIGLEREHVCSFLISAKRIHNASLLVLADSLLEEIGLPLQRNELHPIERIR